MARPEIQPEQGNAHDNLRIYPEQIEDAIVRNIIAHNYTGVVTSACSIKARGEALSYTSILSEIVASGRHLNRLSRSGHLTNVNDISEDLLRDAEADRAVLILNTFVGVVSCARSLMERGIDVRTDTLYSELWVTGRLQHNDLVNFDIRLREL